MANSSDRHPSDPYHPYYPYGSQHGFQPAYHQPMYNPGPPQWMYPMTPTAQYHANPAQPQVQFHNTFAPQTPSRTPLASSSLNLSAPSEYLPTAQKRTAPTPATGRTRAKRRRVNDAENIDPNVASTPSRSSTSGGLTSRCTPSAPMPTPSEVPGIGPFQAPLQEDTYQPPAFVRFQTILAKEAKNTRTASDVWYHVMPVSSKEKPDGNLPSDTKLYRERPKECDSAKYLACRLCLPKVWRAWLNRNGQTENIRDHLIDAHWDTFRETVLVEKLKGWENIASGALTGPGGSKTSTASREPFSVEGFYERLVKWVVVDDQSINVIDSPELRDLLTYISSDLTDREIPHRSTLTKLIIQNFEREHAKICEEVQHSAGRVSFTSDVWSRKDLSSFMAVTAHYLMTREGRLVLRNRLVAFRNIKGSHTGEHLADIFFRVLQELKVLDRVGMITLDNASNNNTMMESLQERFEVKGIVFDKNGNRVRCFPHVTNISSKTGLKHLTKTPSPENDPEVGEPELIDENWPSHPSVDMPMDYRIALESDVVASARKLVSVMRASGQRREALRNAIIDGNERGFFITEGGEAYEMDLLELLRDVDTRWSSTLGMIDRLLVNYPAVKQVLDGPEFSDITVHALSSIEITVLKDIRAFLSVFHYAQQIVSAEKTPTLSIVIPTYEKLIGMFTNLKRHKPNVAHAIDASLEKLKEYMGKARSTKMYVLAMLINPQTKLHFIEISNNWSERESRAATEAVEEAMLAHQQALRKAKMATVPEVVSLRSIYVPSSAARAQANGVARLDALERTLSAETLDDSVLDGPPSAGPSSSDTRSAVPSQSEAELLDADLAAVREELNKWRAKGIMTDAAEKRDFDLILFWEGKKEEFPILYHIALDVIPVQASAVPCERVFSSSKETDTDRRSRIGDEFMEVMQMSKYSHRNERLDFTSGLLATEEECKAVDVPPSTLADLLRSGNVQALESLITRSHEQ